MNLINDGYLLCTMAQNPDVMGEDGVKAAVAAIKGERPGRQGYGYGRFRHYQTALRQAAHRQLRRRTPQVKASQAWKIALITMDSIDQHWVTLNEGAQAEAEKLGVTVTLHVPQHQGRRSAD